MNFRAASAGRLSHVARLRHAGIKLASKGRPLPGTFASGWKHRMDGGGSGRDSGHVRTRRKETRGHLKSRGEAANDPRLAFRVRQSENARCAY
jgi:hypothetical protein